VGDIYEYDKGSVRRLLDVEYGHPQMASLLEYVAIDLPLYNSLMKYCQDSLGN